MAPKGNVTIVAKKVDISHVTERTKQESRQSSRQSGITVSLSNSIIDSAKTVEAMHDASRDTPAIHKDPRMEALAAARSAEKQAARLASVFFFYRLTTDHHGARLSS